MKYVLAFCLMLLIIGVGLNCTVIDSQDYTGQWYSAEGQNVYLFQSGLVYCPEYAIAISDTESVCGAYSYSRNSVLIFVRGIEGLEREREIYLVHKDDGSFLCENKDGTGETYFIRYEYE